MSTTELGRDGFLHRPKREPFPSTKPAGTFVSAGFVVRAFFEVRSRR